MRWAHHRATLREHSHPYHFPKIVKIAKTESARPCTSARKFVVNALDPVREHRVTSVLGEFDEQMRGDDTLPVPGPPITITTPLSF